MSTPEQEVTAPPPPEPVWYRMQRNHVAVLEGKAVRRDVYPSINAAKRANRNSKHPRWPADLPLVNAKDVIYYHHKSES